MREKNFYQITLTAEQKEQMKPLLHQLNRMQEGYGENLRVGLIVAQPGVIDCQFTGDMKLGVVNPDTADKMVKAMQESGLWSTTSKIKN